VGPERGLTPNFQILSVVGDAVRTRGIPDPVKPTGAAYRDAHGDDLKAERWTYSQPPS